MERPTFEEILEKDVRYKNLEKRDDIFRERLNTLLDNKVYLCKRIISLGEQAFAIPEIDDLSKSNVDIELSLLIKCMRSEMEDFSFRSKGLDGEPSVAIDKYIARHESWFIQHEAAMDQAEAAQARIKELLDAIG